MSLIMKRRASSPVLKTEVNGENRLRLRWNVKKETFRKIENHLYGSKVFTYRLNVSLCEYYAHEVPSNNNPRGDSEVRSLNKYPCPEILHTLKEDPEIFMFANRGGLILADSVHFDADKEVVDVILTDIGDVKSDGTSIQCTHGLADGASTNACIDEVQRSFLENDGRSFYSIPKEEFPDNLKKAKFNLEIIVGVDDRDTICRIIEARNKSKAVTGWALDNFGKKFDWIKETLDGTAYSNRVAYHENDIDLQGGKKAKVLEILAYLTCFLPKYDERGAKCPVVAYTGVGTMHVKARADEDSYKALQPLLVDIIELHDEIYSNFGAYYADMYPGGRPGYRFARKTHRLPLSGKEVDMEIPSGFTIPFLAAFRALVRYDKNGNAAWKTDPKSFLKKYGSELARRLFEVAERNRYNPNAIGKDPTTYRTMHDGAKLMAAMDGVY
jgi:hypothetical protein